MASQIDVHRLDRADGLDPVATGKPVTACGDARHGNRPSRHRLEIDPEIYNVNGGSISIGHPFGMTGSRLTGHLVRELQRRNKKYGIVSMCIGGGMGAAGLFEAC